MKTVATTTLVLLVSFASFVCSYDLTYNEFILNGFHRYNPGAEQDSSIRPVNSDWPIITNALAKFNYNGAGPKEGSIEFASLGDPEDSHCKGQMGIEWFLKTYCLQKIVFNSNEYFIPSEALEAFQRQTSGENSNSKKPSITLPVDIAKFIKKVFGSGATTGLLPVKTAGMELHLRDTKDSQIVKINVPLFQESSKSSDQASYADSTLRCKPVPVDQLEHVQSGDNLIEFEIGWISDLFHKPLTELSKDTYVTYPVVMPKENMGKLLGMVNKVNPKKTPVGPLPLATEAQAA